MPCFQKLQYLAVSFVGFVLIKWKTATHLGSLSLRVFFVSVGWITCRFKKEINPQEFGISGDGSRPTDGVLLKLCVCFVELFGWRRRVTWRIWHEVPFETCLLRFVSAKNGLILLLLTWICLFQVILYVIYQHFGAFLFGFCSWRS